MAWKDHCHLIDQVPRQGIKENVVIEMQVRHHEIDPVSILISVCDPSRQDVPGGYCPIHCFVPGFLAVFEVVARVQKKAIGHFGAVIVNGEFEVIPGPDIVDYDVRFFIILEQSIENSLTTCLSGFDLNVFFRVDLIERERAVVLLLLINESKLP